MGRPHQARFQCFGASELIYLIANTRWYIENFKASLQKNFEDQGLSHTVRVISVSRKIFNLFRPFKRGDIILSFTSESNFILGLYFLIFKKKNVHWIVTVNGLGRFSDNRLFRFLYSLIIVKSNYIFVQNHVDFAFFKKQAPNKISITMGSGVSRDFLVSRLQNEVYIDTLGFFGRFVKNKGLQEFIHLSAHLEEYRFLAIGGTASQISDLLSYNNFRSNLILRQFTSNKKKVFDEIDVLLMLGSYGEGFPRVVLEAFARGVIVLSVQSRWTEGWLVNEVNSVVLPEITSESIADALRLLRANAELCCTIRENAMNLLRQFGIAEDIDNQYLGTIRQVTSISALLE